MSKNTTIGLGQGNTFGVLSPLITFDCIFDIDFGLLKLIRRGYFDTSVFSSDFFFQNSKTKTLVSSLYNREEKNPIYLCIKDNNKELADNLYSDFLKEKYSDILKFAMPTEIYNLLESFVISGDIKPTILYKDNRELDILDSFQVTKQIQKIHINELNDANLFNQFFFKYTDDYYIDILSSNIKKSSIYIAAYLFNLEKDSNKIITNEGVVSLLVNKNNLYVIDIYDKSKLN